MTAPPPRRPRWKTGLWIAAAATLIAGCLGLLFFVFFALFDRFVSSIIH